MIPAEGPPYARVYARGAFDDLGSPRQLRFLEEASRLGPLAILLWSDEALARVRGAAPKFGQAERRYYIESLRFVDRVEIAPPGLGPERLDIPPSDAPDFARGGPAALALLENPSAALLASCTGSGIACRVIGSSELEGLAYEPPAVDAPPKSGAKRVVVTGCYDWLHTGHIRFFEEASAYGELNVVIGSDANVRLLKGEGHPLFPEAQRRYAVGSIRFVTRCLVSTGSGWLDAEPEIRELGIGRYVVNEDGDKSEKRRYCEENGIEYIVLRRRPKEGLPRRSSTDLRGF